MKRIFAIALFTAFAIISCKKNYPRADEAVTVEVVEINSAKPVANAALTLYKCTDYDNIFGCLLKGVLATYSTDAAGIAKIRSADYYGANEGLQISKGQYWTQEGQMGKNELCPEGWIRLNIKRTSNYPDSLVFFLFNVEERFLLTGSEGMRVLKMNQRADTTVLIRAFGSQKNALKWLVGEEFYIPDYIAYDTLASGILSPVTVPANGTIDLSLTY
jgi:hypothetical protein